MSFNFMAAITICSDFGARKPKELQLGSSDLYPCREGTRGRLGPGLASTSKALVVRRTAACEEEKKGCSKLS